MMKYDNIVVSIKGGIMEPNGRVAKIVDEELWNSTFDSIADLISIHDKDFKLIRVNKAYADVFGAKPEELIGRTCCEVFHGRETPIPECPHQCVLETKETSRLEIFEPILKKWFDLTASPIFNGGGEILGSVHVAKDISSRKIVEEKLKTAMAELERSNSELEQFTHAPESHVWKGVELH